MRELVFDFETDPIDVMPNYPPKPVGLAIMIDGRPLIEGRYYHAWGHPTANNCYEVDIMELVYKLANDDDIIWIAHNLAFDAAILEKHWEITIPWENAHDTMLLAFLDNPYGALSLKDIAAAPPFNMPPEEQDAVQQWLIRHGVVRSNDKQWGAHIGKAPGDVVGHYAYGDIARAWRLYRHYIAGLSGPEGSVVKHSRDTSNIRA